jgi:glycerol-3-phosphate O-acyltransferase
VLLVPAAVYWGRAPQREYVSWFRLLFSEDWALASNLRRALAVLLNGRNTVVEFGAPVSMRSAGRRRRGEPARRIIRGMTAQPAARAPRIGRIPHRRTLLTEVRARQVRTWAPGGATELPLRQVMQQARRCSKRSRPTIAHRAPERFLRWLPTRIYDGPTWRTPKRSPALPATSWSTCPVTAAPWTMC